MPEPAVRYPCPVCLGVQMEKTRVGGGGNLVLDHCRRCGGMWFEKGEVQKLRRRPPRALWDRVSRRESPFRGPCHGCHAPMDRSAAKCPACGWENRIGCPVCEQPMQRQTVKGVTLDACGSCKGVWFDHAELAVLWSLSLAAAMAKHRGGGSVNPSFYGPDFPVDALLDSPDLVFHGARAAGHAVASSAEALAHAPEAAAGVFSVIGDAAAAVFQVVLEILGSLDF
ncbi:MAG TPA: zf-TFIIB domain-containing protein [Longimicrobiaceae bacterium]|nr:zf-TFIIB domain-containing protein [Longimicrobiaceae bacterium]